MMLSQEELFQYSRQLMLPKVGLAGQRKLKQAAVLIIGAGGLASPASLYLAAAGVGRIGIVDYDRVEISNIQRQILYDMGSLGQPKADAARERLLAINPHLQVDAFTEPFTSQNAVQVSEGFDILVDGTDNLTTRYLINDLCVLTGRPYVFGAVYQFEGQVALFDSTNGPCYRCVFGEPPPPEQGPSCADNSVIGVLPGLVGVLQATETLKIILGIGETLAGKLVLINALQASFPQIDVNKNPDCKVCGGKPQITHLMDYAEYCGASYANQPDHDQPNDEITPRQLAKRLNAGEQIQLIDLRSEIELQISHIPGAEHIPYLKLSQSLDKLNRDEELVLFCRNGSRSVWAQRLLQKAGFNHVQILHGGINAWVQDVDPSQPQY